MVDLTSVRLNVADCHSLHFKHYVGEILFKVQKGLWWGRGGGLDGEELEGNELKLEN